MYTQANTGIPSLDAVLATAQMVTPDDTPTVAAQVAQAAQQKLSPPTTSPGIEALMPGVQQQAMNVAQASQPVTQDQVQQMMQQALGGLSAPNMDTFTAAQGGVIGYSGTDGSLVRSPARIDVSGDIPIYAPRNDKAPGETEAEYRIRKAREAEEAQGEKPIPRGLRWLQENVLRPLSQAGSQRMAEMREGAPAPAPTPMPVSTATPDVPYSHEARVGLASKPAPLPAPTAATPPMPAPRPPAPPAAGGVPQGGVAQLVAPTPESAMASARAGLGLPGTEGLRTREAAYLSALQAQPATGQQGLAALQAQQSELQRMYDEANKRSASDRLSQQLLGRMQGPGGVARADIQFVASEEARKRAYHELQVANATKQDAIIDLQNARAANNAKAALEAAQRVHAADLAVAKAEGDLAAHFATSQASVYGTQVRSQDEAANRATQLQIARIQAAARNDPQSKEALAVARVQQAINGSRMLQELAKAAAMNLPGAQEKYAAEEARLYQRLAPELMGGASAAPAAASNDPLGLRR